MSLRERVLELLVENEVIDIEEMSRWRTPQGIAAMAKRGIGTAVSHLKLGAGRTGDPKKFAPKTIRGAGVISKLRAGAASAATHVKGVLSPSAARKSEPVDVFKHKLGLKKSVQAAGTARARMAARV